MNFDDNDCPTDPIINNNMYLDDEITQLDAEKKYEFKTGDDQVEHTADQLYREIIDSVEESKNEINLHEDDTEADDGIDVSPKEHDEDVLNDDHIDEDDGIEVQSEEHNDAQLAFDINLDDMISQQDNIESSEEELKSDRSELYNDTAIKSVTEYVDENESATLGQQRLLNLESTMREASKTMTESDDNKIVEFENHAVDETLPMRNGDADAYSSDGESIEDQATHKFEENKYPEEKEVESVVVRQSNHHIDEDDDYEVPNDEKVELSNCPTIDVHNGITEEHCKPSPAPLEPATIDSDENAVEEEEQKLNEFHHESVSLKIDDSNVEKSIEQMAVTDASEENRSCFQCGEVVDLTEEVSAMDHIFHLQCLRCTKCDRLLTPGTCRSGKEQTYCEPHYNETFKHIIDEEPVKHSYTRTEEEEELPTPQYTKNMVAKFQQANESAAPSPSTPSAVGKLKIETVYKPECKVDTSPSIAPEEILPPCGSAKRLVEQWSSCNPDGTRTSEKSPSTVQETHYAPNTAKSIAAKFSAGLFDEHSSSAQSGDNSSKSSPDTVFAENETNSHGDELPIQGQARGLIAKFSAMHA